MKITDKKTFIKELRRRRPFDRITADHLNWMSEMMEEMHFADGSAILEPGCMSDSLYFIHSGVIQLEGAVSTADDLRILAELVEGESFPLEALEQQQPVFATFRAKGDVVCYMLTRDSFEEFKRMSQVFAEFCKYRSQSFLDHSSRAYRLHFSHQSEDDQRLGSPLMIMMQPNPPVAALDDPVRQVAAMLDERDLDAAVVIDEQRRVLGIFTMRDLLRKVVVPGGDLNIAIGEVMTASPRTLPVSALGYEAALVMAEEGFHHVILEDEGKLAGLVTEHDLFNLQRVSLTQIASQIRNADTLEWLAQCHRDVHQLADNMLIQGIMADKITLIISNLNDKIISRALEIELKNHDLGDLKVSWVVFGSEGRFEQTLSTDQDNGIIFESPPGVTPDQVRQRLIPIAQRVNKALAAIGFPLCEGNIMAGNPDCCLSYNEWQKRFNKWISEPTPTALLNASIFFDFRHLYGHVEISKGLRSWLADACQGQTLFLNLLMENALQRTPPVGFFRDFVVEDHEECPSSIDLKSCGVTLFVDVARVYALANGVRRGNTKQRLISVGNLKKWPQREVNAWVDSFLFLQSLRIKNQYELKRSGGKIHNRFNPYALNNLDRKFFLESLRQAGKLQKQLNSDFSMKLM